MTTTQPERLAFSKTEVATFFGVSVPTVERMIRSGDLQTIRLGQRRILIPKIEVERLLRGDPSPKSDEGRITGD
ncbi:MAG: helix-turn-helix domain-containing protein [Proteobacteria bacterium]|nr:helix-turn-helix domain-containing protein [Pseudomonadota bacterium]